MDKSYRDINPFFKLDGIHYSFNELNDVAYSLIKEGDKEERQMGDFLMDWVSPKDTLEVKTSGSTGRPKKITLSKQAMVNSALATAAYLGIREKDTALLCLSAGHIAAKMMLVRSMMLGLSLDTVMPSAAPLKGIKKTYNFGAMVPLQLEKSVNELARIKILLVGGAPLSEQLRAKLQNKTSRIFETYGMTETCSHIALREVNPGKKGPIANEPLAFKTLPGIKVAVDKRGCLLVNAPSLGAEALQTNDLIKLISDTEFIWLGRWDNVVNSGGIKLFPERIEEKLYPIIKNRFIITGLPDKKLGEKLVLIVESPDEDFKILSRISELKTLDQFEIPKEIYFLKEFSSTTNGKLDRKGILEELKATS
jgi:O-succinylbenzoic acid--CoA ligase